MSTFSHTGWTVICNQGNCGAQDRTDTLGLRDGTAADVRRILKRRGWAVNIPNPSPGGRPKRLDFCPEHAYLAARPSPRGSHD